MDRFGLLVRESDSLWKSDGGLEEANKTKKMLPSALQFHRQNLLPNHNGLLTKKISWKICPRSLWVGVSGATPRWRGLYWMLGDENTLIRLFTVFYSCVLFLKKIFQWLTLVIQSLTVDSREYLGVPLFFLLDSFLWVSFFFFFLFSVKGLGKVFFLFFFLGGSLFLLP